MKTIKLAIIGSGATCIYCLKHILEHSKQLLKQFTCISIFEKEDTLGYGMPYNPKTTDIYNLSNISSEEIPELPQTFANWLRAQNKEVLKQLNVTRFPIEDSEVYSRIALGDYFNAQFNILIHQLKNVGFTVETFVNCEITDIKIKNKIQLLSNEKTFEVSKAVIATGHRWQNNDAPKSGYYSTPWPIKKILPKPNQYYNYEIGILGASLSAFDVVSSLAHRHGTFKTIGNNLIFQPHKKAKNFKITLHSAEGWLPHLQYEQEEAFRQIYRYTTREQILSLCNKAGFLRIETFFDVIGRPPLIKAFEKDHNLRMSKLLKHPKFSFKNFIDDMADKHEYNDSFIGMKKEMVKAKDSVENDKPIHWMETLDDLMYCLNFHAELMPAEDHIFFKNEIKPFLMSVIAALPLSSAKILLALYDAKVIDLIAGKVEIKNTHKTTHQTEIEILKPDETTTSKSYQLFINCSGNDNVELENYPFKSLVKSGIVRKARAKFDANTNVDQSIETTDVFSNSDGMFLYNGGIDIDSAYRFIDQNNDVTPHLYNISFTHTLGCRPYSYGLQACDASSAIVVESWLFSKIKDHKPTSVETISKIYKETDEL